MECVSESDKPKSINLTLSPLKVTRMLDGLRSLCRICFECRYDKASQMPSTILSVRSFVGCASEIIFASDRPSTHSISMQFPSPSTCMNE